MNKPIGAEGKSGHQWWLTTRISDARGRLEGGQISGVNYNECASFKFAPIRLFFFLNLSFHFRRLINITPRGAGGIFIF